jgi:predicted RNA-binding Zn ribbon-like protein
MNLNRRSGTIGRRRRQQPFLFVGNHPCLDFINTQMIVRGKPTDLLESFEDLMEWLVRVKMVDASAGEDAITRWEVTVREHCFDEAIIFRRRLRTMVKHIVAGRRIPGATVTAINRLLAQCHGYPQLIHTNGHFERRFHSNVSQASRLLTPLAEAVGDLLCSGNLSLVKKCRNDACILYFYDTTKNHARNWCSMQLCGNRIKVAAHYRRARQAGRKHHPPTRR